MVKRPFNDKHKTIYNNLNNNNIQIIKVEK